MNISINIPGHLKKQDEIHSIIPEFPSKIDGQPLVNSETVRKSLVVLFILLIRHHFNQSVVKLIVER